MIQMKLMPMIIMILVGPLRMVHVLSPSHATGRHTERSERPEGKFQQGRAELKIFGSRVSDATESTDIFKSPDYSELSELGCV